MSARQKKHLSQPPRADPKNALSDRRKSSTTPSAGEAFEKKVSFIHRENGGSPMNSHVRCIWDWLLRGPGPKGTTPTIFPYENIDFFAPNVFKEAQPWESSQLPVMVWVCCCKWCALVAALQRPSAHDFHRTPGDDLFGTILGGGFKDFFFPR